MDKKEIVGNEKSLENNTVTFSQFANRWYQDEYSQIVSRATLRKTQSYLKNHVKPFFDNLPLNQVSQTDILKFYDQKKSEGYTEGTIREVFLFLSTLFKAALKKGLIEQNPVEGMKIMNEVPKPLRKREINRLLEVANLKGEGMMYEFILHTRLRLGELLALKWSDFDMDNGTVTIKSGRSDPRKVTLLPQLVFKLIEHKAKQQFIKVGFGTNKDQLDLVFPKENGDIQNLSTVRLKFHRLTAKAGLGRITFHDLRRTHNF